MRRSSSMWRAAIVRLTHRPWFRRLATQTPPGRAVANRFVAGETLAEGMAIARVLRDEGIATMLDYLGRARRDPGAGAGRSRGVPPGRRCDRRRGGPGRRDRREAHAARPRRLARGVLGKPGAHPGRGRSIGHPRHDRHGEPRLRRCDPGDRRARMRALRTRRASRSRRTCCGPSATCSICPRDAACASSRARTSNPPISCTGTSRRSTSRSHGCSRRCCNVGTRSTSRPTIPD